MIKHILKTLGLMAVGITLYRIGQAMAYDFRGYDAAGGELFLLVLPLGFVGLRKYIIEPFKEMWKEACEDE